MWLLMWVSNWTKYCSKWVNHVKHIQLAGGWLESNEFEFPLALFTFLSLNETVKFNSAEGQDAIFDTPAFFLMSD